MKKGRSKDDRRGRRGGAEVTESLAEIWKLKVMNREVTHWARRHARRARLFCIGNGCIFQVSLNVEKLAGQRSNVSRPIFLVGAGEERSTHRRHLRVQVIH